MKPNIDQQKVTPPKSQATQSQSAKPSVHGDDDVKADRIIEPLELDVDDAQEAKADNTNQAKPKK